MSFSKYDSILAYHHYDNSANKYTFSMFKINNDSISELNFTNGHNMGYSVAFMNTKNGFVTIS